MALRVSRLHIRPLGLQLRLLTIPAAAQGEPVPKPFSEMPGPPQLPIIGNGKDMGANVHRFREYLDENFAYGDIYRLKAFNKWFVVVRAPEALEAILRAEGKYPRRDHTFTQAMNWLMKNRVKELPSLLQEDGERWKKLRSAIGKQATPRNVNAYAPAFNRIFQGFSDYIRKNRNADNVLADISAPMKLLFVQLSVKFVFDNDIDVLNNPAGEYKDLVEYVRNMTEIIAQLIIAPPLYKLYNNKLSRDFVKNTKGIIEISRNEMRKLMTRLENGQVSDAPCLLEQWLREGKLTEDEAIIEANTSFGAGVDSTANQTIFLIHAIATNPEVQERLFEELKSVVGESRHITPEHLPQLPYLKGCMYESFRLSNTVAFFGRVLDEECTLLGYNIPPETFVIYSIYSTGRDRRLFPNTMKFDPERWQRDDTHAFAIQPFGFGPRMCYGRRFAELEMKLLLAKLVLNFKLSTDKPVLKYIHRAIVAPAEDVPITFTERHT